ncbi:hypothetical protein CEQ90_05855 [Lewinellaceae bacterium SD302]|nr:hypothetical protein CEQ90_05855 [Lewinellaceae bacterium SD302]
MMNKLQFENALNRLSETGRAKAPDGLLASIEAKLVEAKVITFSRKEWYALAAAIALVLSLNIAALLHKTQTSAMVNDLAYVESEPVFNNYELYE